MRAVAAAALLALAGCHAAPPQATTPAPQVAIAPSGALEDAIDERSSDTVPCFEHAVARDAMLAGHAALDVAVRADGSVESARVVTSTFGARDALHACLVDAIARWRLPAPGAPTLLRVPVAWEGGCPAPAPASKGCLPKETIRHVVRSHLPAVRRCYEELLATSDGAITLQLSVGLDGRVARALVTSSTFGHPPLDACVAAAAQTWRFPRPGGGVVFVTYPFTLKSAP